MISLVLSNSLDSASLHFLCVTLGAFTRLDLLPSNLPHPSLFLSLHVSTWITTSLQHTYFARSFPSPRRTSAIALHAQYLHTTKKILPRHLSDLPSSLSLFALVRAPSVDQLPEDRFFSSLLQQFNGTAFLEPLPKNRTERTEHVHSHSRLDTH